MAGHGWAYVLFFLSYITALTVARINCSCADLDGYTEYTKKAAFDVSHGVYHPGSCSNRYEPDAQFSLWTYMLDRLCERNYCIEELSSFPSSICPEEYDLIIVSAATSDVLQYSREEGKIFRDYAIAGGNLLVIMDFDGFGGWFPYLWDVVQPHFGIDVVDCGGAIENCAPSTWCGGNCTVPKEGASPSNYTFSTFSQQFSSFAEIGVAGYIELLPSGDGPPSYIANGPDPWLVFHDKEAVPNYSINLLTVLEACPSGGCRVAVAADQDMWFACPFNSPQYCSYCFATRDDTALMITNTIEWLATSAPPTWHGVYNNLTGDVEKNTSATPIILTFIVAGQRPDVLKTDQEILLTLKNILFVSSCQRLSLEDISAKRSLAFSPHARRDGSDPRGGPSWSMEFWINEPDTADLARVLTLQNNSFAAFSTALGVVFSSVEVDLLGAGSNSVDGSARDGDGDGDATVPAVVGSLFGVFAVLCCCVIVVVLFLLVVICVTVGVAAVSGGIAGVGGRTIRSSIMPGDELTGASLDRLGSGLDPFEISWDQIDLHDELGHGSFGTVYSAHYSPVDRKGRRLKPRECAVKLLHTEEQKEFFHEVSMLRKIAPHENIVQLYGVCSTPPKVCMVMELVRDGGLEHILADVQHNSELVTDIAYQMALGMMALHDHGVIHRDMASRNVLISRDKRGRITPKICDFGYARVGMHEVNQTKTREVPVAWSAPEVLGKETMYGNASDVWSWAVTVCEMLLGSSVPYDEIRETADRTPLESTQALLLVGKMIRDDGYHPRIPEHCSEGIRTLLLQCFAKDPHLRPDFHTIADELEELLPSGLIKKRDASRKSGLNRLGSSETESTDVEMQSEGDSHVASPVADPSYTTVPPSGSVSDGYSAFMSTDRSSDKPLGGATPMASADKSAISPSYAVVASSSSAAYTMPLFESDDGYGAMT